MNKGFIYLISCEGTTRVKIGYSRNPTQRLRELSTSSPGRLSIVQVWEGSKWDEADIHRTLSDHRVHLEWFDIPVLEAITRISAIIAGAENPDADLPQMFALAHLSMLSQMAKGLIKASPEDIDEREAWLTYFIQTGEGVLTDEGRRVADLVQAALGQRCPVAETDASLSMVN